MARFSSGTVISSTWLNDVDATLRATVPSLSSLRNLEAPAPAMALVLGYAAPNDGGGGVYVRTDDAAAIDDDGAVVVTAAGARYRLLAGAGLNVRQFGARGDGIADDTGALVRAHAAALRLRVPLHFSAGTYLVQDPSFVVSTEHTMWVDDGGAVVRWQQPPRDGFGLRLVGTSAYLDTARAARDLRLPSLQGSANPTSLISGTALQIGDGQNYTQSLTIHVHVQGFSTCVEYMNNCWRITLSGRFLWGRIQTQAAPLNFGESMAFTDAFFADGVVLSLTDGNWHFSGGSLDNSLLEVRGIAYVVWDAPHFENPGSTLQNPLMVDVIGAEATVILNGVNLVVNQPGNSDITDGFFRVNAANQTAGLVVNGLQYTQKGFLVTTHADDYVALVRSGGGRSVATELHPLAWSNFHFVLFADACNQLGNGSFDFGSLAAWSHEGTVSVEPTTLSLKRASNTHALRMTPSGNALVTQRAPVAARQLVSLQVWAQYGGAAGRITLDAVDSNGASLGVSQSVDVVDGAWQLYRLSLYAPAGARHVEVRFSAQAAVGNTTAATWFDAAVLNVM